MRLSRISFPIMLSVLLLLGGCSQGIYNDGVYTAEAQGNAGDVRVQVSFSDGKITSIEILESSETEGMRASVEATLIPAIVKNQSIEGIDVVSGATNTSKAVLNAVGSVLKENKKQ